MGESSGLLVPILCLLLACQGPVAAASAASGNGVGADVAPMEFDADVSPTHSGTDESEARYGSGGLPAVDGPDPALSPSNGTDRATTADPRTVRSRSTDRSTVSSVPTVSPSPTAEPVEETVTFRRVPDRPGVVEATVQLRLPESVTALEFSAPAGTEAVRLERFSAVDRSTFEWDGVGDGGVLTLRIPANGTDAAGRANSVGAGEWALVRPLHDFTWWYRGSAPPLETTVRVADEGVAGETYAYLGASETVETEGREPIRLVVAEAADLPNGSGPDHLASLLASASEDLAVGGVPAETTAFVAPSGAFDGARLGWQTGRADAVLLDEGGIESTAVHEYVHVRQDWRETDESRWLAEATANYYEWYDALDRDRWTFDRFERVMATTPDESAVLADPSTWAEGARGDRADYQTGALVVGDLDRRIRLETGGRATFQDVLVELDGDAGAIEGDDVFRALESVGGPDVRAAGETYVTTAAVPEMWNATAHRAAFGSSGVAGDPEIDYAFAGDEFRVTRPVERTGLRFDETVAVDEAIGVPVRVTNAGEAAGAYEATLRVDGEVVDATEGRIVADAERTEFLGVRFVEAGTYALAVGDREREITVERVRPAVGDLAVEPEAPVAGEPITVRLTAEADGDRPVRGPVAVELEGDRTETIAVGEDLTLRPSETDVVEATVALDTGTYTFSVGDHSRVLTVEPGPGSSTRETETGTEIGSETEPADGAGTAERGIVTPVTPVVGGEAIATDGGSATASPVVIESDTPATDADPRATPDADGNRDPSPGFGPIVAGLALVALVARSRR